MLRASVGRGQAHAKVILFGEHAVVHGEPAIALPLASLPIRATARWIDGPVTLVSALYAGPLDDAPPALASPRAVVTAALQHLGVPPTGIEVAIEADVPPERGLGSSAAVAGALVRALADLVGHHLSDADYLELVAVGERAAHGSPSGLDASTTGTTTSTPVWFETGVVGALVMQMTAVLVVADTGVRGSTRQAVGRVKTFLEHRPVRGSRLMASLGSLAHGAARDMAADRPQKFGERMNAAHEMLRELGVSSAELDALHAAATAAGALGAKLTGGGMGGCLIALAQDHTSAVRIADALTGAGAVAVWLHPLSPDEAEVDVVAEDEAEALADALVVEVQPEPEPAATGPGRPGNAVRPAATAPGPAIDPPSFPSFVPEPHPAS